MLKNILLVEDDLDVRLVVREQLIASGHSVVEAQNGDIALTMIGKQSFDLVITDIDMPEKNGLELLEEVRRTRPQLPVIVMTGGSYNEKLVLAAGASAFVQKPFIADIGEVVKKLSAA
jgi:CheY-like chemotaxis protein